MLYRCYYPQTEQTQDPSFGHALGRALLREALLWEKGTAFFEDMLDFTQLGKPYLRGRPGIHFSISHTRGLVACALGEAPLGVDVERLRPFDERVARRVCTKGELERAPKDPNGYFMSLWTLKESYAKATGQGISLPFCELDFSLTPQGVTSNLPGWAFTLWESRDFVTALCRREPEKPR